MYIHVCAVHLLHTNLNGVQFSLTPLYVGLVFLAGPFSYMIFAILAGPLSDKLVCIAHTHLQYAYSFFRKIVRTLKADL